MSKVKFLPLCLFAIVLTITLLYRLYFAKAATFPGGGDYAFYYTVAKNLGAGRPFQIDYIWHYLYKPETITHSSLDFWAPLTSVLIFFSFRLFEQSTTAALIPAVISGILLSIPTYFLSRYLTKSPIVSWAAAFLVLFIPSLFNLSLTTESGIHYALFVNFSLLFMVKGHLYEPGYFLTAAVFAALSHLTRVVHTFLGTITSAGSFYRSSHAIIPYLIILALNQLHTLCQRFSFPVTRRSASALFSLVVMLLGLYFVVQSGRTSQDLIRANNKVGENLAPLADYLNAQQNNQEKSFALMAAFPWEVNLATGHPVIVIPRDGYDSLFRAANQYDVDYLLLPAPSDFLTGLHQGTETNPNLQFACNFPETPLKLYRFQKETPP